MDNKRPIFILALVAVFILLSATIVLPAIRRYSNEVQFAMQKADDETSYKTRKAVEDTCRAEIASYENYVQQYYQNINSYEETKNARYYDQAQNAKLMANAVAARYNEYILKNSFVFDGNIPKDIRSRILVIH